jgi:hypothetical protein
MDTMEDRHRLLRIVRREDFQALFLYRVANQLQTFLAVIYG